MFLMPCSLRAGSPNLPSPNVLKEKSQQVQFPDGRDVALCKAMVSYKHWLTLTLFSFFFVITIPSSSSFSSVTSTFMKSRNGHIRTNFVRFPHRPLTFSDVLGQRKGEQKTNLAKTALCNESFTQMRIQQQIKGVTWQDTWHTSWLIADFHLHRHLRLSQGKHL